jgi:membrane-associated phospholipid phosphatase
MSFINYIIYTFFSNDTVERNFCRTICFLAFHSFLYIILNPQFYTYIILNIYTSGDLYCTLYTGVLLFQLYNIYKLNCIGKYTNTVKIIKIIVFIQLLLCNLFFYNGSNNIQKIRYSNNKFKLYDDWLIYFDSALFPNLQFGQLSLYIDYKLDSTNTVYKICNTILQLSYFSYYFWGNLLLLYFGYLYLKSTDKYNNRILYRIILKLLTSWVSGFLFSFTVNLLIPAVSPRIYLKNKYTQPLNGFFPFQYFNNLITDLASNTFSSFPSAHNSFTFIIFIISYNLELYKYSYITLFASFLITISTIVLRYHYFIDILCSFFISYFSLYIGGFYSKKKIYKDLQIFENEDISLVYN